MTKGRQGVVALLALAAGAGAAGAVGAGADQRVTPITLRGENLVDERRGNIPLTISGREGQVLTISGRSESAREGEDFNVRRQVLTLPGVNADGTCCVITIDGASIVDDEADEAAEAFAVEACAASADGGDEDCNGTTDEDRRTAHPITIADDDGALDAAICSGLLRPVGLLLTRLKIAGAFQGCSP